MIFPAIIFVLGILNCINSSTATKYIVKYVEEEELIPSPEPVIATLAVFGDESKLYPTLGLVGGLLLAGSAIVLLCCKQQNTRMAAPIDSGYSIV